MGFDIYIKKEFLNQSIGQFTDRNNMLSKKDVCDIILNNKSWYVPKGIMRKALKDNDDKVTSVFRKIDGRVLNRDAILDGKETTEIRREDNLVEKQEVFQLVKDYYRQKGIRLSDEEVANMKMYQLIDIITKIYDELETQGKSTK